MDTAVNIRGGETGSSVIWWVRSCVGDVVKWMGSGGGNSRPGRVGNARHRLGRFVEELCQLYIAHHQG